jgi:hypothetical protein
VASVHADKHYLAEGEAAFEDGTMNYLNLSAVETGLRHLQSMGIDTIHERVRCLAGWLLDRLRTLRHGSGQLLVRLYGPPTTEARGGTITVNFYDARGQMVDHGEIERRAAEANISIRTGCFCNPGAAEIASGIPQASSPPASGSPTTSARSPPTTSGGAWTATAWARCVSAWGSPATSPTSSGFSRSPKRCGSAETDGTASQSERSGRGDRGGL